MTNAVRRILRLGTSVFPLLLFACGSEEVDPTKITVTGSNPGFDRGGLSIGMAPREEDLDETQAASQAQAAAGTGPKSTFHVFMDGRQLYANGAQSPEPLLVYEWARAYMGRILPGPHHFEIRMAGGGPTVFAGDADVRAGWETDLYLFGPTEALQGRFVSYPDSPARAVHIGLINLIRKGPSIELVTCPDGTGCVSASAPLALGETLGADFPVEATGVGFVAHDFPAGTRIGFRQVPSTQLPDPPVQQLWVSGGPDVGVQVSSAGNWTAAPFFMYPDGVMFGF